MADDDDILKQRVDDAQGSIGKKKSIAKARFFGMADRLENLPAHDDLREKLNRIRQHVKASEDAQ